MAHQAQKLRERKHNVGVMNLFGQIACVLHDTGRLADAERVAVGALDALNRRRGDDDHPDLVSARGALSFSPR